MPINKKLPINQSSLSLTYNDGRGVIVIEFVDNVVIYTQVEPSDLVDEVVEHLTAHDTYDYRGGRRSSKRATSTTVSSKGDSLKGRREGSVNGGLRGVQARAQLTRLALIMMNVCPNLSNPTKRRCSLKPEESGNIIFVVLCKSARRQHGRSPAVPLSKLSKKRKFVKRAKKIILKKWILNLWPNKKRKDWSGTCEAAERVIKSYFRVEEEGRETGIRAINWVEKACALRASSAIRLKLELLFR